MMDLVSLANAFECFPMLKSVGFEARWGHWSLSSQATRLQLPPTALGPFQEAARSVTGML